MAPDLRFPSSPEISQLYSQVFWKGLDPVDLPPEIVERYRGKGMAIVGFEMDQVRRVPSKANASVLEDVSVPLTVAVGLLYDLSQR